MQDTWEEKAQPTAVFWHKRLSKRMGTQMFRRVATRLLERETWFPQIEDFVREAKRIRRAKRNKRAMAESRRRQEQIRKRRAMEAREEFPDALLTGKRVAKAITSGEYSLNEALPADTEESFRKADQVNAEEES